MAGIPLTRCQFLMPFTAILDAIGAPSNSLLAKYKLPSELDGKADHYIPLLPAIRFAEAAQCSQEIIDFGFEASKQMQYAHLSEKLRTVIGHSPTLLSALKQVCKWATLEDTVLNIWLERWGDQLRICSKLQGAQGHPYLEHSQWLQLVFKIHIVRQFAGESWNPATIAFEAHYVPTFETQSRWPTTRFLSGEPASWIDVPVRMLSLPGRSNRIPALSMAEEDDPPAYKFLDSLKLMLPSYLGGGVLTLAEAAEIAGLSTRSFQRKLARDGLSYSDLVDAARFDNASKLLRDTDSKIIEIALSSGYGDHAHFTRAFRRMTGVSPRQYRAQSRNCQSSPTPC